MQEGLSEEQIEAVDTYTTSELYSSREVLALTYADRVTLSNEDVDDELFAQMVEEFETPAAIVELTAIVAFENFRSKFNHTLLVESNGVCLIQSKGATE